MTAINGQRSVFQLLFQVVNLQVGASFFEGDPIGKRIINFGEAEVIESAQRVLESGAAERVRVDLTEDFTTWSPAVCGGVMDVFVERVEP